ncbi:MAG TPA: FAD-dependent oxidoreductase [Pseudomonadales bacterium]
MNCVDTDIVIIGGGIAGLWTLATLRQRGFAAVLLEKDCLGGVQSIASQGIIHGGSKYALGGKISDATSTISQMPALWRDALNGNADVDLRGVQVLSDNQYLVPAAGIDTRLLSFLGSRTMASYTETVKAALLPAGLQQLGIHRTAFRLNEIVVDTRSVFAALRDAHADAIYQASIAPQQIHNDPQTGWHTLQLDNNTCLRCRELVLAAGSGNAALTDSMPMQRRPLHMVMAKGRLPAVFAHFIGRSSKPLLTITSHPQGDDTIWYLGGDLAEKGVALDDGQQIDSTRKLLGKLLPDAAMIGQCEFATLHIDRAEPLQSGLRRPDDAFVERRNNIIIGWPTKLALAPRFADKVLACLAICPAGNHRPPVLPLPSPALADYPWSRL